MSLWQVMVVILLAVIGWRLSKIQKSLAKPSVPGAAPAPEIKNGKVMAILCYIPILLIGPIVSIICMVKRNNAFALYHAKQGITLMIPSLIIVTLLVVLPDDSLIRVVVIVLSLVLWVFWALGIVNAARGKYQPVPITGQFADKMFGRIQVEKK